MWLSVPEAARHLGISERAVRKRIVANTLVAEREGVGPWRVRVDTAAAPRGGTTSGPGAVPDGPGGGPGTEPIEAAYRVAGEAAAEIALVPLATMVEELRGLADQLAELARRNEGLALEVGTLRERQVGHEGQLAAKDAALAAHAATIAELRRRAEVAEVERECLMAVQAAPDALGATEGEGGDNSSGISSAGFWARVRRVLGGG